MSGCIVPYLLAFVPDFVPAKAARAFLKSDVIVILEHYALILPQLLSQKRDAGCLHAFDSWPVLTMFLFSLGKHLISPKPCLANVSIFTQQTSYLY